MSERMLAHLFAWSKRIKNAITIVTVVIIIVFFIIVTKGLCAKLVEFSQNLSGATSFRVSTNIWESLLNAKKLHFCSDLYLNLT